MINKTEKYQCNKLRNKEYFESIMCNSNIYLFFGKLDLNIYFNFLIDNDKFNELQPIQQLLSEGERVLLFLHL
jgi:hypothetical protein